MSSGRRILALNCGSSSLKFGVYSEGSLLLEGEAEEIGRNEALFWTRSGQSARNERKQAIADHAAAFDMVKCALSDESLADLGAIGHRVVHGGPKIREHVRLDGGMLLELQAATAFAPLHLPASLAVIAAASKTMAGVPQVICLDTTFHKDLPDVAKTLPFSAEVRRQGIERYGFHGLSMESIVEQLESVPDRTVVAHLGNGSSITALCRGKSVDTSMGMTPAGGVMMGTRSGDVDPGVMTYLLRHGFDTDRLERLVDHESGLKGVSERSSDVRELSAARKAHGGSDLALRMFAYQAKKMISGMAAALSGLDLLVFTGGIGEHADEIRHEIQRGLEWIGKFEVKVLPSQEDLQIARITRRLLSL